MLNFLQQNQIQDMAGLDEKFKSMIGEQQRYLVLKEEVKEAEKIRKSVYSILRQEQREQQPRRAQDMER